MSKYDEEQLQICLEGTSQTIEKLIRRSNTNATKTYNTIVKTTQDVEAVKRKVTVLGDMLTDLLILNGNTKNLRSLGDLPVISNKNIAVTSKQVTLDQVSQELIEFTNKDCTVISAKPITIKSSLGKPLEMSEIFKYSQLKTLSVNSVGYTYEFVLVFPRQTKINNLTITLPDTAVSYPLVEKIYYNRDGGLQPVKIQDNGLYEYSLDDNRTLGNIYSLELETVYTKELRFTLTSKTDSVLELLKIECHSKSFADSGEIIFGPLVSSDPILKVGISSDDLSENVTLAISTDLEQWIPLLDSMRVDTTNVDKIVSFNTVSETSFKTTEDIRNIYIKLILESEEVPTSQEQSLYESSREDGLISDNVLSTLEQSKLSAYRMKETDLILGADNYFSSLNLNRHLQKVTKHFYEGGLPKVFGFQSSDYSVSLRDGYMNSVNLKTKPKRLEASKYIDATTFDPVGAKLVDIALIPVKDNINTLKTSNIALPLSYKEDDYRLYSKVLNQVIELRIDNHFSDSFLDCLYEVPEDDILLLDSMGSIVKTFTKESLLSYNGVFFVNLTETFYNLPVITNYSPNYLFPIVPLKEDEYSLLDGTIHLGKGSIVEYKGYKYQKTIVDKVLTVSYENGNTIERTTPLYTYHQIQKELQNVEVSVIKLANRSIEKGSLTIKDYNEIDSLQEDADTYIALNKYIPQDYLAEDENTLIKE